EIKISVLVDRDSANAALEAVHQGFGLEKETAGSPSVGFVQPAVLRTAGVSHEELERDVVARLTSMEDIVVSEVHLDRDQARVTIRGLPDVPGVSAQLFAAVAEGGVMVDLIVQNAGRGGHANLSFTVPQSDLEQCLLLV